MLKKILSVTLVLVLSLSIVSCALNGASSQNPPTSQEDDTYMQIISSLQTKIDTLEQQQSAQMNDAKKEIDALRAEIESLKETPDAPVDAKPASIFSYKLLDGKAYITGFTGDDENIVIPSQIDGFDVSGIGERAFEGYKIKSVIISNGVETIDWFAFYGCAHLVSITVPSSVSKIGYSAFEGTSRAFTIYCHNNSFAHSYAQSYGITYAII